MDAWDELALTPAQWPWPLHDADYEVPILFRGDAVAIYYDAALPATLTPSRRYRVPSLFDALFLDLAGKPALPLCQLRIVVGPDGPECVKLTLDAYIDEPLTTTRIRVPLADLVDKAIETVGAYNLETGMLERDGFWREMHDALPGRRSKPGTRLLDEDLERASNVYRDALSLGKNPTDTVAEKLHISRSTAGRWLVEARRRGLLGPTTPGVAGELPMKKKSPPPTQPRKARATRRKEQHG
jgi:hypothetical protein